MFIYLVCFSAMYGSTPHSHFYSLVMLQSYVPNTYSTYSKRPPEGPYSYSTERSEVVEYTPRAAQRRFFSAAYNIVRRNVTNVNIATIYSIYNARARPLEAHTLDNRAYKLSTELGTSRRSLRQRPGRPLSRPPSASCWCRSPPSSPYTFP